jgi:predicted deacylase
LSGNKGTRWITLTLILVVAIVAVVGLTIGFAFVRSIGSEVAQATATASAIPPPTLTPPVPATIAQDAPPTISPTDVPPPPTSTPERLFFEGPITYGHSFNGFPLLAHRLGTGPSARAIIGGIHGGYEWNTVVLVSQTLEHLQENPTLVPDGVTLYIIPCANPDGYAAGHGLEGRVNGNGVDLNRNWDYHWQMTATHGTRPVFATYELAVVVSEATGYPIADGVPGQITTGDAVDWMSAQGLAGIEVELTNHEDIEWERNLQGLRVFLNWMPPPLLAQVAQTAQVGTSVQGRPLEVTRIGNGDRVALVIVGGIHGDEGNTEALVRGLMEQYTSAPGLVPPEFALYFLPTMNPDGLAAGTRQNANQVDLNRNWPTDDWQTDAARTSGIVPGSGGTAPGSEPEIQTISRWLLDTVKPSAQEVWLLSYHSAYPPDGGVQPGYPVYGTPSPQADKLAQRVADLSGYTYLPTWPTDYPFTGELIHWCDVNGIWAADVELPNHDPPDTVPSGGAETMLETHQRVLSALLASSEPATRPLPDEDGYIRYTVQSGEGLLDIAFRFEVEMEAALRLVEEIIRLNGIVDEDHIEAGQELLIPVTMGDQQ